MCGINGLLYFDPARPVEERLVHKMRAAMHHRGPDDHGIYTSGRVGLGFNRLSIIDLSGGHQPIANEDGTVWLVFNGEIYNFEELRERLIGRGHRFQTRSDTETIVHGWEEYGEGVVEHLRGMFAFAIWDSRQQVFFAARDRLGIKPFYYCADKEKFAFASEMKALLELPDAARELDLASVETYLQHRYVIAPRTILRGIQKLPPGHTLLVKDGRTTIRAYWDLPLDPLEMSEAEALENFRALLDECVKSHLIADVPLGVFLSGGLDSSSIVACMSHMGARDIKTFSVGYDSKESELGYAGIVAKHFHTDHHELRLTPTAFRDFLPRMVWFMDEPVGDEASIPLFYLSEFARQKVKVVLSGEGSDEILGGYDIYRTMIGISRLNAIPGLGQIGEFCSTLSGNPKIRKYASMLGRPLEERYGGVSSVFSRDEVGRLLPYSDPARADMVSTAYGNTKGLHPLTRMTYLDLKTWMVDDLLTKADRMSMANSLELRVPFLDHKLVEFAFRTQPRHKLRWNGGKQLLKLAMEPRLPREIIYRRKKGFPVPVRSWLANDLAGFARETLLMGNGAVRDLLDRSEIETVLGNHNHGYDQSGRIYALLVFDQWCKSFLQVQTPECVLV